MSDENLSDGGETQTGLMFKLNRRVAHIQDAVESLKKAPVLSLMIGGSIYAATFILEELASDLYSKLRPSEVELLTASLVESSAQIEDRVNEVLSLMEEVRAGADIDPDLLQQRIDDLVNEIDGIRPALFEVSELRREFALASVQQKDRDIEVSGFSLEADVVIRMNDGFTFCGERFNFGISHSGNRDTERPRAGLTSPTGETVIDSDLIVGDSISVGGAIVNYVRTELVAGERLYGFSFFCPS